MPSALARDPLLEDVTQLTRVITSHGGHCGYVGRPIGRDDDGYWAERQVIAFIAAHDRP